MLLLGFSGMFFQLGGRSAVKREFEVAAVVVHLTSLDCLQNFGFGSMEPVYFRPMSASAVIALQWSHFAAGQNRSMSSHLVLSSCASRSRCARRGTSPKRRLPCPCRSRGCPASSRSGRTLPCSCGVPLWSTVSWGMESRFESEKSTTR